MLVEMRNVMISSVEDIPLFVVCVKHNTIGAQSELNLK